MCLLAPLFLSATAACTAPMPADPASAPAADPGFASERVGLPAPRPDTRASAARWAADNLDPPDLSKKALADAIATDVIKSQFN
ncbi:hypothetical protein [Goodfellowiella coeruleoviolacea]|uniref:hypothetical protein n=1 Tax=Goodfellowiella coeruleoviolacea TaxID=334858 RepID=UPI0020A3C8D6|nr:hypothetical protein [Goodfellowiella coeruleoviolacea]